MFDVQWIVASPHACQKKQEIHDVWQAKDCVKTLASLACVSVLSSHDGLVINLMIEWDYDLAN